MNAPLAKEQIALLMSDNLTYRVSPVQGTEAAAPGRRSGLLAMLVNALHWVAELPRRQATLAELSRLSDRELADIGLARGDLKAVFARARV